MRSLNKRSFPAVSMILLLLCIGYGQAEITPRITKFSNDPDQIRVASFNIRVGKYSSGSKHWSNRREMVISLLAGERYDVIGLQEALDFQIDEIHRSLPQYEVYAIGRGDQQDEGETCAILYRKNRFYKIDSGTIWFSSTPWEPGSKFMGTLFPRICSWVRLADLETARCFYLYNLHMDNLSQKSRSKSVRILAEQISLRRHPDPFVVMGDFNMELSNPAMMYLQQFEYKTLYPRLQDTWAAVYPYRLDEGTFHKFKGDTDGPKIDHILVGEGCRVLAAAIDHRAFNGHYPSDHFPVSAVVDLW
jgi:endonuclease/exonuclease/phosphatase family metal-dependent hydrolase